MRKAMRIALAHRPARVERLRRPRARCAPGLAAACREAMGLAVHLRGLGLRVVTVAALPAPRVIIVPTLQRGHAVEVRT